MMPTAAKQFGLSITMFGHAADGAVLLVGGLPGSTGEAAFVLDGDRPRALWPMRSQAVRRPECPLGPGLPSLTAILLASARSGGQR